MYKFQDGTVVRYQAVPHLDTAISYLYVREKTGRNDGVEVTSFLKSVNLRSGYAWCAAFVSYCLKVAYNEIVKIRSARALDFRSKAAIPIETFLRTKQVAMPGDIFIMANGNGPMGHIEFIYKHIPSQNKFLNIGGNTNSGLSREGDGVYPTTRQYKPYARLHVVAILRANQ